MTTCSLEQLNAGHCGPCEGGVAAIEIQEAQLQLKILEGWSLGENAKSIFKSWNCKNFVKSLAFCNRIGELAESEGHHPDLHLTGYRHVQVVLTTHAISGLSANDFMMAAKIDALNK